jgi:NhaP-type Na+/H+ and K+/H+ antiporter
MIDQIKDVIAGLTPTQIVLNIAAVVLIVFWMIQGIVRTAKKKQAKQNRTLNPAKGHHVPQSVRVSEPLRDDYDG